MPPIDPAVLGSLTSALMSPATPDITIDIRTADHGRNAENPKPDDQVQLTLGSTSNGNGRITVATDNFLEISYVRIGNG